MRVATAHECFVCAALLRHTGCSLLAFTAGHGSSWRSRCAESAQPRCLWVGSRFTSAYRARCPLPPCPDQWCTDARKTLLLSVRPQCMSSDWCAALQDTLNQRPGRHPPSPHHHGTPGQLQMSVAASAAPLFPPGQVCMHTTSSNKPVLAATPEPVVDRAGGPSRSIR